MSILKLFGKKVNTAQIQIAISQVLIGIFCMRFSAWNNAVKALMKKQKYKSVSLEL